MRTMDMLCPPLIPRSWPWLVSALAIALASGCARGPGGYAHTFETTAYCSCGECNGYDRGSWYFLWLDRWNKRINYGPRKGKKYTGRTASGGKLHKRDDGLLSLDSLVHPWRIPLRLKNRRWFAQKGTIAADTRYYPFGTKIHIDGYGWGVVEDIGGAIKGPDRLDLFFSSHKKSNDWGRRKSRATVYKPE